MSFEPSLPDPLLLLSARPRSEFQMPQMVVADVKLTFYKEQKRRITEENDEEATLGYL